jgi:hypothetical protein
MTALALRARNAASTLAVGAAIAVACVGSIGAMLATDGNPAAVLAPALAAVAVWLVLTLPIRLSALGVVFLLLISDYPPEIPYSNLWVSPFNLMGKLLFTNLSTLTGIGPLRLPAIDMMVIGLLVLRAWRRSHHATIDVPGPPPVHALNRALLLSVGAVLALDGIGVATGGEFNESLWQLRHLLLFPLCAFLFIGTLRGTEAELKTIARILLAGALVKALCGIYFIYFVLRPTGGFVEFTTSHSDTLLYVSVFGGFIAYFFERPRWSTIRDNLWWMPIVFWGMVLNDRRLAYVSLGGSVLMIYLLQPNTWLKRRLFQLALVTLPVAALYLSVGWGRGESIFQAAQIVRSLVEGEVKAAGADYRDIENADVISTWAAHPVVPLGFGHKFHEPIKLPDISKIMPTYQYHPHNQFLWMWAIGGVFGFTLMFLPWVVGLFLAARAHKFLRLPFERAAALTIICLIIAQLNQVFGDMGTRSHFGSILGGLAVALAGKLAVRSGAWPGATGATGASASR